MPRKPDLPCADCGNLMWRSTTSLPEGRARCRACRFSETTHGTRRMYREHQCRCAECKAWNAEEAREYQASFRKRNGRGYYAGYARSRPAPKTACVSCGDPVPGSKSDKPLHRACRQKIARATRRRADALRRSSQAAAGTSSTWAWVTGECAQCLTYFVRHGQSSRFCSSTCRRKAHRAWKIALRDRLAIYERDGWTCQICTEPVDRDLMTTDPGGNWAPSLDHIEPQSWALIPDHSPENLRLAHRWCNSVRGDLTHYSDSDLQAA